MKAIVRTDPPERNAAPPPRDRLRLLRGEQPEAGVGPDGRRGVAARTDAERPAPRPEQGMTSSENLADLTPEELVESAQGLEGPERDRLLGELYQRFYPRVARWCLRVCGDRDRAEDIAQEVFVRVHTRLDSFQGNSRFSTWLYTVTRRVAINRSKAESRREMPSIDLEDGTTLDPVDEAAASPEEDSELGEIAGELRRAIQRDLEPLEAQVLYLHFVDGLTLPALTELLELTNKSGAKAYLVAAKRKLKRRFGRWLEAQHRGGTP